VSDPVEQPPPRARRVLAIDPGDRRTGLAGTDPTGTIAVPLQTIEARDEPTLLAQLTEVVRERQPELILVGVARHADGRAGERARKSAALMVLLARTFPGVRVEEIDEAHSTDDAHARLKAAGMRAAARKKRADAIAALVMIERYLAWY
jgi:putative Holliday junction resolvase